MRLEKIKVKVLKKKRTTELEKYEMFLSPPCRSPSGSKSEDVNTPTYYTVKHHTISWEKNETRL